MVWYNLEINKPTGGSWKVKYTPLKKDKAEYAPCDKDGNELIRIKGTIQAGYYANPKGEKVETKDVYKLVNGKPRAPFVGRIKMVEKPIFVDVDEASDLLTDTNYLVDDKELYDYLKQNKQAIKFGAWFGNGMNAKRCYIAPDKHFDGYCRIYGGDGQASEVIGEKIAELEEGKRLAEKLKDIDLKAKNINRVNVEELL